MVEDDQSPPERIDLSELWKTWTPKDFLSTALHELRTPILLIRGFAAVLADETHKEMHPHAVEAILQNAERLEKLWNAMADYNGELMRRSGT